MGYLHVEVSKHLVHYRTMKRVEIYTDLLNELGKDHTC